MWELWVKNRYQWNWRVIGAETRADLLPELAAAMADPDTKEMRVISEESQRPGVVA